MINDILGRIFGGNSGYVGYSKSKRAVEAEERGLRSKSQMNKEFADLINQILVENGANKVSLRKIKDSLNFIRADEWHHTSKFGNQTNYYSPEKIANFFLSRNVNTSTQSEYDIAKEFNSYLESKLPYTFAITPESNGVKIAVFTAANGINVPYKSGFGLLELKTSDTQEVKSAKAHFNNEKKFLLQYWQHRDKIPLKILKQFDNMNYFRY
jgi:aspartate carbamoyltransferase regulatory subunit